MERLTFEGNFCEISRCEGEYRMCSLCEHGACDSRKVWERLKDYEGTGLEPKEINGLKLKVESLEMSLRAACDALDKFTKAEQEGRLLVPPCKVGDTVYMPTGRFGAITGYVPDICDGFHIARDGVLQIKVRNNEGNHGTYGEPGKTAFLTREDAEKALGRDNNVLATDNIGRKEEGESNGEGHI